jgi:trans-aconitate 3-methyltransferase
MSRNPTYAYSHYSTYRPEYSPKLYKYLLANHKGPLNLALDLGCGHGLVSRALSPHITQIRALDPSPGMLAEARRLSQGFNNIKFVQGNAESLPDIEDGSVDLVVSATAVHWFEHPRWAKEMARMLRKGGTLAFWAYADVGFVGCEAANEILLKADKEGGVLHSYWAEGKKRLTGRYRDVLLPEDEWEEEVRLEHVTGEKFKNEEFVVVEPTMIKINNMMEEIRTWSGVSKWKHTFPERVARSKGGKGDVVDEIFDEMRQTKDEWINNKNWLDSEVEAVWGTVFVMARRK